MATKSRSRTRPSSRSSMQSDMRENMERGSGDEMRGQNGSGLRGTRNLSRGIHVTAEMPDPRVARIIIDIEWQHLASRFAHKVGQKIKRRMNGTQRARSTRARTPRSSA